MELTNSKAEKKQGLVFDIGANDGADCEYYLKKGMRVVAVEANEELAIRLESLFSRAISERKLSVVNAAISDAQGEVDFYINQTNSLVSSLDENWARRDDNNLRKIKVRTITIQELVKKYGVPFYIKIDIEGADMQAIKQLTETKELPKYLSVEDCRHGYVYLAAMKKLGYQKFQLSNQYDVGKSIDKKIMHKFKLGDSGKFGADLEGSWLPYLEFMQVYEATVRSPVDLKRKAPPHIWWDIHASLD